MALKTTLFPQQDLTQYCQDVILDHIVCELPNRFYGAPGVLDIFVKGRLTGDWDNNSNPRLEQAKKEGVTRYQLLEHFHLAIEGLLRCGMVNSIRDMGGAFIEISEKGLREAQRRASESRGDEYNPKVFEEFWQMTWCLYQRHKAHNPGDANFDVSKPSYYVLSMFPYPSGAGLHAGHVLCYTATDVVARKKRHEGFNVLNPTGWDAMGLPAEQHAIKTGVHPEVSTRQNCSNFKGQMERIGLSFDWTRELSTADPEYVRWTQWIFARLYEAGLAYQSEEPVWWCPELGTVLADEEVTSDGLSDVGGHPCEKRNLRQWMLKITEYAQRLLDDLEDLDWPEHIKKMQRDRIGRSEGADILFDHPDLERLGVWVFTTRAETLFGATYVVLAPEHDLVDALTTKNCHHDVMIYREAALRKSDTDRKKGAKTKTGVFTGSYLKNPLSGDLVPVWVGDYVLGGHGTGAIMSVPAHDERDFEFATEKGLPAITVIDGPDDGAVMGCYTGEGVMVNSGPLDGMYSVDARRKVVELLELSGTGNGIVRYNLRDWLFSRQRLWGEPIPIIHNDEGGTVLVPDEDLPVRLPEINDFSRDGSFEPPLSKVADWAFSCLGIREGNVMPQWAGSSWYYLRFIDPFNSEAPWSAEAEKYWMSVDLYIGGAEHAESHLLYSRFWHKVLYDLGLVRDKEPFQRLFNQGMIKATAYKAADGAYVRNEDVSLLDNDLFCHRVTGALLEKTKAKMSKSLGNIVSPDDIIDEYGADVLRLAVMFAGPIEAEMVWDNKALVGVQRLCRRIYKTIIKAISDDREGVIDAQAEEEIESKLNKCIKTVSSDIEEMKMNTAIAALMIFVSQAGNKGMTIDQAKRFTVMVSPFAPHLAEELWMRLGEESGITYAQWPAYDEALIDEKEKEIVVQVNGKVRDKLLLASDQSIDSAKDSALELNKVKKAIGNTVVKQVYVVEGKLINFVTH